VDRRSGVRIVARDIASLQVVLGGAMVASLVVSLANRELA
jgi:hypothetical protein